MRRPSNSFRQSPTLFVVVVLFISSVLDQTGVPSLFLKSCEAFLLIPKTNSVQSWGCASFSSALFADKEVEATSTTDSFSGSDSDPDYNSDPLDQDEELPQRSLYEILGAQPTETRAQLKRRYVKLARLTHPDAILQNQNNDQMVDTDLAKNISDQSTGSNNFNEIATAWSILSDDLQRKRYDRSLQAERISADISSFAMDLSESAKPAADLGAELLEKVAFPFLRRTTATTLAGFQAAAEDITAQRKRKDSSWSLRRAMAAAQRAGRAVDKMEILEKAQDLEARAVREYKQAMELQNKLSQKAEQRLKLSLHTAQSGLTASEALLLLEDFNRTASPSIWDRARMFRATVETQVKELQRVEDSFVQAQMADSQSQDRYRQVVRERLVAKTALQKAKAAEKAALEAYERAKQKTVDQETVFADIDAEYTNVESQAQKASYEMERKSVAVESQSEKVRHALRQKEKALGEVAVPDSKSKEENEARLKDLAKMREDERGLSEESAQLEVRAARLLSRANKLKMRAKDLEQKNGKRGD